MLLVPSGLSSHLAAQGERFGFSMSFHPDVLFLPQTQAIEPNNHGQKSPTIWQKCLYSLKFFLPKLKVNIDPLIKEIKLINFFFIDTIMRNTMMSQWDRTPQHRVWNSLDEDK